MTATGLPGEGAGGGSLSGHVFYDANRNGERQAGEAGVEVLLDGRYRTLTDRDGRFEFPRVTTGHHQLTLTPESVPPPWGTAEDLGGLALATGPALAENLPAPAIPNTGIGKAVNVVATAFTNLATVRSANWIFSYANLASRTAGTYTGQVTFTASTP